MAHSLSRSVIVIHMIEKRLDHFHLLTFCHCLLTDPNLQKLTAVHAFNVYLIIKNHKKNNNLMQIL